MVQAGAGRERGLRRPRVSERDVPLARVARDTRREVRLAPRSTTRPPSRWTRSPPPWTSAPRHLRQPRPVRDRPPPRSRRARRAGPLRGATLVLDVTQSAGVVPLDARAGVDVLVTSGYKWLCSAPGPGSTTAARALGAARPAFVGWKSRRRTRVAFDATTIPLAKSARRLEYSTPAYAAGARSRPPSTISSSWGSRTSSSKISRSPPSARGLERLGAEALTPAEDERRAGSSSPAFPGTRARRGRASPRRG